MAKKPTAVPPNRTVVLLTDLLYDIAGGILYAVGIHCFTAPSHIAPGGVTGLATIVNYFTGFPIGTFALLVNLPLLAVGLKFLGKKFTLSTLKTVLITTMMIDIVFAPVPVYSGNPLLAALFGGLAVGAGLGIIFMRGSTTGGTDIVTRLLQLKYPYMSMGRLMLLLDMVVLVLSVIAFHNIEAGLYGLITIFASSRTIDSILYGMDRGNMALIVSGKNDEIAQKIMNELGRGVTRLQATGGYSQQDRPVLLCAMGKNEFYQVKQITYQVDPKAFIIVTEAGEILGEGFKPMNK